VRGPHTSSRPWDWGLHANTWRHCGKRRRKYKAVGEVGVGVSVGAGPGAGTGAGTDGECTCVYACGCGVCRPVPM
jgi:hypothetical protein